MTSRLHGGNAADVLLCAMPFGILATPSLALGLLQASLAPLPVRTRQRYFSFRFARLLGFDAYQAIARRWGTGHDELGEWIFAQALFPGHDLDKDRYVDGILRNPAPEHRPFLARTPEPLVSAVLEARRLAEPFLEACLRDVEKHRARIVGFTCLFQQRLASLGLARLLKERSPDTFVVFGGVDCEGVRGEEIVRQFPFVDAVVSGPGETVFPEIVSRVLEGRSVAGIEGVTTPAGGGLASAARGRADAPGSVDLDTLPLPAFDDYFADFDASGLELPIPVYLSLETSRGCWWGQKSHCAFCSINGSNLAYRSKSPARVVHEVEHFALRYPGKRIVMTDSILDPRHLDHAIPKLAQRGFPLEVQYETRATLSKQHLRQLRAAGVSTIQPGIESLSTPILRLMRKGTSLLDNIRVLKWGKELGLSVYWNILVGFPGEPREAYSAMERLVPLLTHLQPPQRFRVIEVGRYSPLFEEAETFGLTEIAPSPAYAFIYPFEPTVRRNLATYFTYRYQSPQDVEEYTRGLGDCVSAWWQTHATSELSVVHEAERSLVRDRRASASGEAVVLEGLEHVLLRACDDIRGRRALGETAAAERGGPVSRGELECALMSLEQRGLMVSEGGRHLGLAVVATG